MRVVIELPESMRGRPSPGWLVSPKHEWHGREAMRLAPGVIRFAGDSTYHLIPDDFLKPA